MYKLHVILRNLYVCGFFDTRCPLIGVLGKVVDEARPEVLLGDLHNAGHIEILPKLMDHIRRWEEDARAIPHVLPHIRADER